MTSLTKNPQPPTKKFWLQVALLQQYQQFMGSFGWKFKCCLFLQKADTAMHFQV